MVDSTANQPPSDIPNDVLFEKWLGQLTQFVRVMRQAGLPMSALQMPIDDPAMRGRLVRAWLAGVPDGRIPAKRGPKGATLARALTILGVSKMLTDEESAKAWGVSKVSPTIRYTEHALRAAANANACSEADWRLVYVNGFSLREQRHLLGTDPKQQPCFDQSYTWLLSKERDVWAAVSRPAGYYLIDFHGRFDSISWIDQELLIEQFGNDFSFERADETIVSEAVLTIFKVTGERLMENWRHWGRTLDHDRERVYVGEFDHAGWHVFTCHPGEHTHGDLRVCLSRKFSF